MAPVVGGEIGPSESKALEKKTLKEVLEDRELGRKLLSKGGFKCLI